MLVVGCDGIGWVRAAKDIERRKDISLPKEEVYQLAAVGNDGFYEKYSLSAIGCVLIRPDGFVAWAESA